MRKTCEKIKVDAEYRWFLGIPFGQKTPHYSKFSQNYIRRFEGTEVFEKIFVNIVEQTIKNNLVKGETFFTDSTHKKANANKNKYHSEIIKEVGIDSGYNTLDIKKYLHDNNIYGVIAYRRYAKDIKESDCYVCPKTGIILEYTERIDRNGYKYYSNKENCKGCPEKKDVQIEKNIEQ